MSYPSRLRPRGKGVTSAQASSASGAILGAAKVTVGKLDGRIEVGPRNNPIDVDRLMQDELAARMAYGRARRHGAGRLSQIGLLLAWGMARLNRTRLLRAFNLFFFHYGTVMAAGAAYMMFFSVAALIWAGFSVAGIIIGENPEYQLRIIDAVQLALPGVIGDGGLIGRTEAQDLFDIDGLNFSLGIAVALAVFTSLSWMHGLRSGIRSIWERPLMAENVVFVKLKDFVVLLLIGVAAVSSAVLGLLSQGLILEVMAFFDLDWAAGTQTLVQLATFVISFGLDMMIAVLLMRVASRLVMPLSALWQSALIAGVGASLLRLGSSQLLQNFADSPNPLLQTFGTVLGVFFYFFIFGLVYLFAASWGAVAASDQAQRART